MKNDVLVAARLPSSVIAQIDAIAARMSKAGVPITRTEVVRMLLLRGVERESRRRA
jgi:hypothetical protein